MLISKEQYEKETYSLKSLKDIEFDSLKVGMKIIRYHTYDGRISKDEPNLIVARKTDKYVLFETVQGNVWDWVSKERFLDIVWMYLRNSVLARD